MSKEVARLQDTGLWTYFLIISIVHLVIEENAMVHHSAFENVFLLSSTIQLIIIYSA